MTRNFTRLFFCLLPLTGCAVHIPEPSPYTNLQVPAETPAEAQLLDVAIGQFTFKAPVKDGAPDVQQADIRKAESRYMPVMLRHALTQAGAWGGVYVLPEAGQGHDVRVEAEILESESHTLRLRVGVSDATGAEWFERIYTEHVGVEVHGENSIGVNDPFDGLYNRIANDMLSFARDNLDATDLANIRQTAELQFGNEFAPGVYGGYLATNRRGISTVVRMPPDSDPAVVHLQQIRQRDRAFQELLQQHYVDFAREITNSYLAYRHQAFQDLRALQSQQREARNDMVMGGLLIGVAVATHNVDDVFASTVAATAAVAGATQIVTGVRNYTTEQPFAEELAASFAGDVVTEVVSLDDEVVTLSGSTEGIYVEWKDILRELFQEDRGPGPAATEGP
jgi:hypothetical protein